MAGADDKAVTIRGVPLKPRRFTRWAALYFALFFCLPFLSLCLLIDVLLYSIVTGWLGHCYALLCLFD